MRKISYWLQACRLRTLLLSLAVVGLGSPLAYKRGDSSLDLLLAPFRISNISNFKISLLLIHDIVYSKGCLYHLHLCDEKD